MVLLLGVRQHKLTLFVSAYSLVMRPLSRSLFVAFTVDICFETEYMTLMLADTNTWPPEDPTAVDDSNRKDEFTLPSTPWTYNNGSLNPNLQPSNAYMRS